MAIENNDGIKLENDAFLIGPVYRTQIFFDGPVFSWELYKDGTRSNCEIDGHPATVEELDAEMAAWQGK